MTLATVPPDDRNARPAEAPGTVAGAGVAGAGAIASASAGTAVGGTAATATRIRNERAAADRTRPLPVEEARHARAMRGNILFFFFVLCCLGIAWKMRSVLEIVYCSALFAVVLMPVVQQIQKLNFRGRKISRPVAILALVGGVALALTLFLLVALPPVLRDLQHFAHDIPERMPKIIARLRRIPLVNTLGLDSLEAKAEGGATTVAQYVLATLPLWLKRILDIITAFILCIYFMLEGEFAYFYFLSFFPRYQRDRLSQTLVRAEERVSKWLIGQGSLMLILGVASTVAFGLLHVRYFVLLGVLMGLFNIIPVAGGVITVLLAAGVAALDTWSKMAGVFIFYGIYVQVENAYLTPRIMKTSVNLIGLAVLIALLAGSALAGVVGALVAVPTAALVAVFIDEYLVEADARDLAAQAEAEAE